MPADPLPVPDQPDSPHDGRQTVLPGDLRDVMNDAGPPLDDRGGIRQADQRTGWHVMASLRSRCSRTLVAS